MIEVELPDGSVAEFPDGTPQESIQQALASYRQPERSFGQEALRKAEFAARGFTDSALETVAAVPELVASGMRAVGLPAPERGTYTDALKSGFQTVGETLSAPLNAAMPGVMEGDMSTADRFAYGGGRGVADAASIALPAAAVARGAKAGTVTQRAAQALASQPVLQATAGGVGGAVGEATDSPLLGTAAALTVPLVAGAVGRARTPIRSTLSPEESRLARVAQQNNIPLTPAQRTGSRPLQTAEAVFETLPLTSGPQEGIREAQRKAFNRAVLKTAGINADEATPNVLQTAKRRLGNIFTNLSRRNTLSIDNQLRTELDDITTEVRRYSVPEIAQPVINRIDDLYGAAAQTGNVPGDAYRKLDSAIGRTIRSTTNGDLRNTLGRLQGALREAMDRSISPKDQTAWRNARREYANLMTITRSMGSGTADAVAGNIPPAQLKQALASGGNNRQNFAMGRGELNDLARVGQNFVRGQIPNSGTPERTMMMNLLQGGGPAGGAMIAGADPLTAATVGGTALLGPRALQMLYNTPLMQSYLTNTASQAPRLTGGLLGSITAARLKDEGIRGGLLAD